MLLEYCCRAGGTIACGSCRVRASPGLPGHNIEWHVGTDAQPKGAPLDTQRPPIITNTQPNFNNQTNARTRGARKLALPASARCGTARGPHSGRPKARPPAAASAQSVQQV